MPLEFLLNPVFGPLLNLPPLFAVIIVSFLASLIITVIYKFTTDQNLMKRLKEEMKELQKEMKELKDEPQKVMEVQKRAMHTNLKYMSQSFKSTLITFVPIILIFGWMNSNLAFEPIKPNREFTATVLFEKDVKGSVELNVPYSITLEGGNKKTVENGKTIWLLKAKEEGDYLLEFKFNSEKYQKEILISNTAYKEPIKKINDGKISLITIDYKPKKVLNLFGWKLGWLGTYIIFSIIFSMLLRKILKIY